MSRLFVNQIQENQAISEIYCIVDKALRPNKNGVLYLQFLLKDRTGTVSGRLWNATESLFSQFSDGDYVRCEGTAQRFLGNLQVIAKKLTKVEPSEVSPEDFSRETTIDVPALLKRLRELAREIKNQQLYDLVDCFLADEKFVERFSRTFAGVRLHHTYPGGLLDHTVTMMEIASRIAPLYSSILDVDLLLTGAFLHDVGKTLELSDDINVPVYTDEGQGLGHPHLGVEILCQKIAELETMTGQQFDSRLALILKHMILSHHGSVENGSAKVPMCLEALALHFIDTLDAKLTEFNKYILDDPNSDSFWTNYIQNIDRKLMRTKAQNVDE
ncbi:MAG: HD domain-containing protein [Thermoguttaceae bacterium]|nr:HD domain-containing protein [Thermoguttaceae bacterium]